eukprot:4563867-Amphidinium_carterae.1
MRIGQGPTWLPLKVAILYIHPRPLQGGGFKISCPSRSLAALAHGNEVLETYQGAFPHILTKKNPRAPGKLATMRDGRDRPWLRS